MIGESPLYAAIDLGSNSFHMLVVRNVGGSVRAVSRVKRKIRLASGLDDQGYLNEEAMERGLDCLKMFAEQLANIPDKNIRIVGTATLRLAKNANVFINRAEAILRQPIEIISGEEEARTIYHGVMSTSAYTGRTLVIDIGGASTELIIGVGPEIKVLHSTSMGCVTWLKGYFADGIISPQAYAQAIEGAKAVLAPYAAEYLAVGFDSCIGASGTVQALHAIMSARGENEAVTYEKLLELKNQTIACGSMQNLSIEGLTPERLNVFPSGLAVLMAIFELFSIKSIVLAGGALREGIIYGLWGKSATTDVRLATVDSLILRYQLDRLQALFVTRTALEAFDALKTIWNIDNPEARSMLRWAAMLHEIGLCIEYKNAPKHAAYIIDNIVMPGFTVAQKKLLSALMLNQRDDFIPEVFTHQNAISATEAVCLARILRVAIILCMCRSSADGRKEVAFEGLAERSLKLHLPSGWKDEHYLRTVALKDECSRQLALGWNMEITEE